MKELAQNLKLREGAKEIYLISHRVFPNYRQPCKTAKDWMLKNHISYTKLILSKSNGKVKNVLKIQLILCLMIVVPINSSKKNQIL